MGHSMPNWTAWKILIFDFLHLLTFFSIHQKTFPGKFWNFFHQRFKRYRFSVFRSQLLQKWSKFKYFFLKFLFFYILYRIFFTYFLEKNTIKLFKVFLYAIFEFKNFNLVFETVLYPSICFLFDNFLYWTSIHSTNFKTGLIVSLW